jgi:hypothetical protein
MIKKVNWSSCKVPVIPVRSYWNLNFLDRFSRNTQIPNLTKIRPVGAELLHADGRTDRLTDVTKLIVTFRNFAKALKMTLRGAATHTMIVGRQPTADAATWPQPQATTHKVRAWLQVSSSTNGRPYFPLVRDPGIKPYSRRLIPTTAETVSLFSFSSSPVAKISACSKLLPQRHQQTTSRGPHAVRISCKCCQLGAFTIHSKGRLCQHNYSSHKQEGPIKISLQVRSCVCVLIYTLSL